MEAQREMTTRSGQLQQARSVGDTPEVPVSKGFETESTFGREYTGLDALALHAGVSWTAQTGAGDSSVALRGLCGVSVCDADGQPMMQMRLRWKLSGKKQ